MFEIVLVFIHDKTDSFDVLFLLLNQSHFMYRLSLIVLALWRTYFESPIVKLKKYLNFKRLFVEQNL